MTRFNSIVMLFLSRHYKPFILALLNRVKMEFERDEFSPLMPLAEKSRLFERIIAEAEILEQINDESLSLRFRENQSPILLELINLQPGYKRIWIHATRRKAIDRDILLAEEALKFRHLFPGSSRMLWLFLTTYERYRFCLRFDAHERALWVAAFWILAIFGMTVDEFQAWYAENAGNMSKTIIPHKPLC